MKLRHEYRVPNQTPVHLTERHVQEGGGRSGRRNLHMHLGQVRAFLVGVRELQSKATIMA